MSVFNAIDLGALGASFDKIVDPAVGIVRRVWDVPRDPGTPDFFHYAARAANTAAFGYLENFGNTGGASVSRRIAVAKATGEAVERYSAAMFQANRLPLYSYAKAPFPASAPADFALHSAAQYDDPSFPWAPFDDNAPIRWTPALDVLAGTVVHVPAAFVWIPYQYREADGETPIGQPISTGLSCHGSWAQAALGGACEVLERDAFTLMWQARLQLPRIRVETLSAQNYGLVRRFEATGDEVYLINITTDLGVPVILSLLMSDRPERPAQVFAASCDPEPETAVRKALEELAHTRRYAQQVLNLMPLPAADNNFEVVEHQAHHLRLAADPESVAACAFIRGSRERIDFDDIGGCSTGDYDTDLLLVAQRIAQVGHRLYIADLTSPDVRELGLTVVRAVAPGLHPLFMGHKLRALGGERLRTAPQRYAPGQGLGRDEPANSFPHPYP